MLRAHPVVLDAIEVSRTRLQNRVVVACAVDLRRVQWRRGEIVDATVAVCAGTDGVVRVAGDADGPAYANREQAFASRGEIPLNAIALRELAEAAGGFFVVEVELRSPTREETPLPPRIAGLTVQVRGRRPSLESRTAAAA